MGKKKKQKKLQKLRKMMLDRHDSIMSEVRKKRNPFYSAEDQRELDAARSKESQLAEAKSRLEEYVGTGKPDFSAMTAEARLAWALLMIDVDQMAGIILRTYQHNRANVLENANAPPIVPLDSEPLKWAMAVFKSAVSHHLDQFSTEEIQAAKAARGDYLKAEERVSPEAIAEAVKAPLSPLESEIAAFRSPPAGDASHKQRDYDWRGEPKADRSDREPESQARVLPDPTEDPGPRSD